MKISINFDERQLRRALEAQVQAGVKDLAADYTRRLESLRDQMAGRPVEEIKPHLRAIFRDGGGDLTEPELTEWAQLVSDNTRIMFKPEHIQW
jgi:hypothetical protein